MSQNQLYLETSPYLLQHKDNAVHWQPWGEGALAEANREGKPILLSVGYAACHWCHVMAHESFENKDIASLMNEHFVSIKVDREERPDLDMIYQSALAMLGERGGWPLTMFLTPDGDPFWGGTYFPPEPRFGRPGFPEVLRGVSSVFQSEPEKIANSVEAIRDGLKRLSNSQPGNQITREALDEVAKRLVREIDPFHGGIGGAPKFPQTMFLEQLWRAWKRTRQAPFLQAVELTLGQMSQGGIYDHIGGGFSRYTVDDRWLVPHFEKMLYDNALLVELLTLVWQETGNPLYGMRVSETLEWVLRDMVMDEGAFASSFDADSEGEEGKFYVWSETEVDALLGENTTVFKSHYDVTPSGNWEGKVILNRLRDLQLADEATEATLADCRRILLGARAQRVPPGKDDKVLADWNGLMISALTNAAAAFDRDDWLDAARRTFAFVEESMVEAGRLMHSWRVGRPRHPGNARRLREFMPRGACPSRSDRRTTLFGASRNMDRDSKRALRGFTRWRIFFRSTRHTASRHAGQDSRRQRGTIGKRHPRRRPGTDVLRHRQRHISRWERGDRSSVRGRARSQLAAHVDALEQR